MSDLQLWTTVIVPLLTSVLALLSGSGFTYLVMRRYHAKQLSAAAGKTEEEARETFMRMATEATENLVSQYVERNKQLYEMATDSQSRYQALLAEFELYKEENDERIKVQEQRLDSMELHQTKLDLVVQILTVQLELNDVSAAVSVLEIETLSVRQIQRRLDELLKKHS